MKKLEFGPFFTKRLLYESDNENIVSFVDALIAENKQRKDAEVRQKGLRVREKGVDKAKITVEDMDKFFRGQSQ